MTHRDRRRALCTRAIAAFAVLLSAGCGGGAGSTTRPDGDGLDGASPDLTGPREVGPVVDGAADAAEVRADAVGLRDGGADLGGDGRSTMDSRPADGGRPVDAGAGDAATDGSGVPGDGGCPASGSVTYTLARAAAPTAEQLAAYDKITAAMDTAVSNYNCYTSIKKALSVSYVPSVATADGNINGSIRFGSQASMNHITAMHEIAHTVGIGTTSQFQALVKSGVFTGTNATNQLLSIPERTQNVVNADTQHFWPYGLNYTTEVKSTADLINHCKMVVAIRKDMGL